MKAFVKENIVKEIVVVSNIMPKNSDNIGKIFCRRWLTGVNT